MLLFAALCVAGYSLVGEYQAEEHAQNALEQVEALMEESFEHLEETADIEAEDTDEEMPADGALTVRMVNGIDYIGIVEIPSLSLKLPVIDAWDDEKLKIAPCRYMGTAYDGTMIISGHSYKTHFRYIRKLTEGDSVIFTDLDGVRFVYKVTSYEIVGGADVDGMLSGEWDMSLFTCTYNGSARHTVRCKLIPEENPWLAERTVPESNYEPEKGGWTGLERVSVQTLETMEE